MMKRVQKFLALLIVTFSFAGGLFMVQAPHVSAQNPLEKACSKLEQKKGADARDSSAACDPAVNQGNPLYGPDGIIIKIANVVAVIAGAIAVIMIIVAGIGLATSTGDSQSVSQRKNAIIGALVGLVIIGVARGLVGFVMNRL